MKRFRIISLLLIAELCLTVFAFGRQPAWLDAEKREQLYSGSQYLKAFATNSSGDNQQEILNSACNNARTELAAQIRIKIDSHIIDEVSEISGTVHAQIRMRIKSRTNLELTGLVIKKHYDKKTKTGYALALLDRYRAYLAAIDEAHQAHSSIETYLRSGDSAAEAGKMEEAIEAYSRCVAMFLRLSESLAIARVTHQTPISIEGLTPSITCAEVHKRLSEVINQPVASTSDAALILAHQLESQVPDGAKILPGAFYYENSEFTSTLGERLKMQLMRKFDRDWRSIPMLRSGFTPGSRDHIREVTELSGADWIMEGRMLPTKKSVDVMVSIIGIRSGQQTAIGFVEIPNSVIVDEGLEVEPKDYIKIKDDLKKIADNDIRDANAIIEIWTDRGSDGIVFHQGDTIRLRVRSSQAGYVNILNLMSNGVRTVLYQNFYIGQDMVNKGIPLPEEFGCYTPFGCETIIASFATQAFPLLHTTSYAFEGESYQVLTEDLKDYLEMTRSSGRFKNDESNALAEARLHITTME
ncbi:MAG: hypothetical protein HQ591_09980 [candidate division Zixibacteria bacterium]|nr:hypothetical protein [Candidatus Tariuqbacter arcticus]